MILMKQFRHLFLALATFGGILFSSCLKDSRNIPTTPVIEFKSFSKAGDSADFIFTFKDGDGNIGLGPGDTTGQYHISNSKGEFYYNLHMIYYYKDSNGNYHRYFNVNTNDSHRISVRIPNITPIGQNKILDGEIKFRLDPPYALHSVIRFDAYIYDRDLNKSNVITTPDIVP